MNIIRLKSRKSPGERPMSPPIATSERTAPSWLNHEGRPDWRRNVLMIGAIHRPQRSTRTPSSTRLSRPGPLKRALMGARLRSSNAASRTALIANSGAASDQLMTPEIDSA